MYCYIQMARSLVFSLSQINTQTDGIYFLRIPLTV